MRMPWTANRLTKSSRHAPSKAFQGHHSRDRRVAQRLRPGTKNYLAAAQAGTVAIALSRQWPKAPRAPLGVRWDGKSCEECSGHCSEAARSADAKKELDSAGMRQGLCISLR